MRTKEIILVLTILFSTVFHAISGEETIDSYLKTDQLSKGTLLKLHDPKIYKASGSVYNAGWGTNFDIQETRNAVELFLNTEANDFGKSEFSLDIDLKLTYKNAKNKVVQNSKGKDTSRIHLSVDYSRGEEYKNRDIQSFKNAHKIYLEITNVSLQGTDTTSLTDVVFLRSFINVDRYYDMKNSQVKNLSHQYHKKDNELEISWKDKKGAAWYDLQWAFVDNYGYSHGSISRKSKSNVSFNFDDNSQQIRTKKNQYRIPIVFEEGYLVYRVRPLAKGGSNFKRKAYGKWSLGLKGKVSSAGNNVFTVTPSMAHEKDKMNWQYQATYRENGDKEALVKYYDGLNYKRQVVKQYQSGDNVIISEDYYDYKGRNAVNVLPAPRAVKDPHPNLKYYEAFNKNKQGKPYNKSNFDDLMACAPAADPMSKISGAAKYYSSGNNSNNPFKEHLPKSEGYPFTQTQYMPDKTGDERRIGKPGKAHQIGNGHAVQKFNGTPGQSEMDRLFGSEIGYARHYRKRLVANENGQLRVQYLNEEGNPVASALAGDKPKSLEKLPSDQVKSLTIKEKLLKNRQNIRGNSIEASKKILVATEGSRYSFKYTVNPSTMNRYVCDGESVCYDGIYNLRIRLTNECGDIIKDTAKQIGSVQNIDEKCNDNQKVTVSFSSGPLSVGSYFLSKKLEINEQALQKYLDLFAQKSCIQKKWDTLYEENRDKMDTLSCNVGCGQAKAIKKTYTYTTDDGKKRTDTLSDAEYARMQQQRRNLCGNGENMCQSAYDAMIRDMSPGGQYAQHYDSADQETDPTIYSLSVLNTRSNQLPGKNSHWRNPDGVYRNENGDTAYISITSVNGPQGVLDGDSIFYRNGRYVVRPENLLYISDFIDLWEDSWAKALLPYHPEYGYYLYCKQHPASNNYDRDLLATGKYKDATDSGYIAGNGTTNLLSNDPFFNNHPNLKTRMKGEMQNFVSIKSQNFSLEEIVIAMHNGCAAIKCGPGNVNVSKLKQCINNNKPLFKNKDRKTRKMEWSSYRSIYLAIKREIMHKKRHQFAINHGYYNGCISVKGGLSGSHLNTMLDFYSKYNVPAHFKPRESCFACVSCYSEKEIRFPDGDDIYKYVEDLNKSFDAVARAEQLENYADNKLKRNCDKCPVETELETLLNGITFEGDITTNQDTTQAMNSCGLKNQMNAANKRYFSWQANISGRELTGNLMAGQNKLCTIKLYDSTNRQVNWDEIVLFTCLQHTTKTNHYQNTQTRNFKVRAVTKDNEAFWLEGVTSCIDLTDCDIEKFCTPNPIAKNITALFSKVFGLFPEMRQILVNNGYQQIARQKMPLFQNTKLIKEVVAGIGPRLKNYHKSPGRKYDYYWIVDSLSPDKQNLVAGIYGPKKNTECKFNFEILNSTKQFGDAFVVDKILLNHPSIQQEKCDAKAFVMEVRPVNLKANSPSAFNKKNFKLTDVITLGDPYFIKVTNECYDVGECCPESNCPDIAGNGDFEDGTNDFTSDLPYSQKQKGKNYYTVYPTSGSNIIGGGNYDLTPGGDFEFPGETLHDLNNINLNPGIMNGQDTTSQGGNNQLNNNLDPGEGNNINMTGFMDFTGDTTTDQDTGYIDQLQLNQYRIQVNQQSLQLNNKILQNRFNVEKDLNLKVNSNLLLKQYLNIGLKQNNQQVSTQQLIQLNNSIPKGRIIVKLNHYLIIKVSDKKARDVWKQSLKLDKTKTYSFSVKVKPMNTISGKPIEAAKEFSIKVGNQNKSLELDERKDDWFVLKGYFDATSSTSKMVTLRFTPFTGNLPNIKTKTNINYRKWAVDDIVIKPQSCEKPSCCPPLSPKLPDTVIEDPCTAQKKVITKANTDREFRKFLEDTLTGIESAYRNAAMSVDESLTMSYTDNFYKYTLYYYDQSGNLIKTVPPKGFKPLSKSKVQQVQSNRNSGGNNPVYPNHKRIMTYKYNSYDELVYRKSPDEGVMRYWYDEFGRRVAKQSAAQAKRGNVYTYTLYDELNRKVETGEVQATGSLSSSTARDYSQFENWVKQGTRTQVVHKYFDESLNSTVNGYFPNGQRNLRKRQATVVYEENWDNNPSTYDFATHFSYDAHGHVNYLIKENTKFVQNHQVKKVDYDFDIITGNVDQITYQPGSKDQFIHKYTYDEDNRLSKVLTSRYGLHWEEEAKYYFYPHGKIARIEMGEEKIQGLDFAYTIQGWLKGINGSELEASKDAGKDGANKGPFTNVTPDAVSMVLDYYKGDYKAAGGGNLFTAHLSGPLKNSSSDVYTSDVRQMVVNNAAFDQNEGLAMAYSYDQLRRLVKSKSFFRKNNTWQSTNQYETSFSYDANGNITSLKREGDQGTMDQLTYHYKQDKNILDHLSDQVGEGSYPNDIDDQKTGNYRYDAQGRLTQDLSEGLQNLDWNRHDKVTAVVKKGYGNIYNYYDGTGDRVMKDYILDNNAKSKVVSYVRGVNNEILAKYKFKPSTDSVYLTGHYIHGRSRLGVYNMDTTLQSIKDGHVAQYRGNKHYEIGNHLDNVMVTVSDKKMPDTAAAPSANKYRPDIVSATGYYPYGSQLPGRKMNADSYGHGYQGKEKDNELKGDGNAYYFKERMYDPRIGRWLSIDPNAKKFPGESPYIAMSANPVSRIDDDGAQDHPACSVEWGQALKFDTEMQKSRKASDKVKTSSYGDAWAVNTGDAIYAYKTAKKSDFLKLANMSPVFSYMTEDEFAKSFSGRKMRIKTTLVQNKEGDIKAKSTVSVYMPPVTSYEEEGTWMPVKHTMKGQQVLEKKRRDMQDQVIAYSTSSGKGIIETRKQAKRRKFLSHVQAGNALLTNPGASVGVLISSMYGEDMEDMKRRMKMGAAMWSVFGASVGTVHNVHRSNISSGPGATQRTGDLKSKRGAGQK